MSKKVFTGKFGEKVFKIHFEFDDTYKYFQDWLSLSQETEFDLSLTPSIKSFLIEKWQHDFTPFYEFTAMTYLFCDELLNNQSCIFHGVSFLYQGRAYLLTAPSGTGKSTQLFNLLRLFPDEIQVMNGDKPILVYQDHQIMVYPSPWKGKEHLGNDLLKAPLAGIFVLEQAKYNRMSRMPIVEAVKFLMCRIFSTYETKTALTACTHFVESLVIYVPIWKLENLGDDASTKLIYTILKENKNEEV